MRRPSVRLTVRTTDQQAGRTMRLALTLVLAIYAMGYVAFVVPTLRVWLR